MVYAYCLYCQSQRCKKIAAILECRGIERAISPEVIQNHRKQGRLESHSYDLLPGYIFVYSSDPIMSFESIKSVDGIIKVLGDEKRMFQLEDTDYHFAMNLYEQNGVVGNVKVIKVGDIVRIDNSLLSDMDATVLHIDYRKQRAHIAYKFDKQEWKTWVSCDVIFLNENSHRTTQTDDKENRGE